MHIAQDMARDDNKQKKIRQMRWQNVMSELTCVIPRKVSYPAFSGLVLS